MIRPNFFIVGAPKCGTSALWHYLSTHPQIVMPKAKEPHYFASDMPRYRVVDDLDGYLAMFQTGVPEADVRAAGEASVYYLYSKTAIRNIKAFDPRSKLIAMVRNPVDMLHSFHGQLTFSHQENKDFRTALRLQAERRLGKHIPHTCVEPSFLQYLEVGRLGDQIERMLETFPRDQVKILLFEDLGKSAKDVYEEVLTFLDVPSDGRTEFPVLNAAKKRRSGWIGTLTGMLTYNVPKPVDMAIKTVKRVLGVKQVGLMSRVRKMNRVEGKREAIPADLKAEIAGALREDVAKLGRLLDKDLSHWVG